jgi:hypothetical protein
LHKQTRREHFQSLVNAGFFDMEWIMLDLTKNEVQQRMENVVLCIQKVPLQGFSSVTATSVLVCFATLRFTDLYPVTVTSFSFPVS